MKIKSGERKHTQKKKKKKDKGNAKIIIIYEKEVKEELKPWRLPFWTETPSWLVEKKENEKKRPANRRSSKKKQIKREVQIVFNFGSRGALTLPF